MNRMLCAGLIAVSGLAMMVDQAEARHRRRNRCCYSHNTCCAQNYGCQTACNGCEAAQNWDPNMQQGGAYYRGPQDGNTQDPQFQGQPAPRPAAPPAPARNPNAGGGNRTDRDADTTDRNDDT